MLAVAPPPPAERQHLIAQARSALLSLKPEPSPLAIEPWIVRSWQRCLANGHRPAQQPAFNMLGARTVQRAADQHATLLRAARPVLAQLTRAIAGMHYFALLTDARGVVIEVQGAVDRNDPPRPRHRPRGHRPVRGRRGHHGHRRCAGRAAARVAAPGRAFL